MSCVFLSKSIPCCLPHSFLNKLADEFQSKCGRGGSVKRSGGSGEWNSFKARWVWIIRKMGQEEEEEKRGGGERFSSIKSSPPCLHCLSFLWQRTDAVTRWGQSILRAIAKHTSNDTVGQKVAPIKTKSMNTILSGRKNTRPVLSFFSWKIPTMHFMERCNRRKYMPNCKYLFQSISWSWISQVTCW